jgi:hypothetical protein
LALSLTDTSIASCWNYPDLSLFTTEIAALS